MRFSEPPVGAFCSSIVSVVFIHQLSAVAERGRSAASAFQSGGGSRVRRASVLL
jgi:hypothetical protein